MPMAGQSAGVTRSSTSTTRARKVARFTRAAESGSVRQPAWDAVLGNEFVMAQSRTNNAPFLALDQDLRRRRAGVVGRRHHRAIGAGRLDRHKIARFQGRKGPGGGK